MADELIHKTVGVSMTQAEFEDILLHQFNNQATGDLPYASSATQLRRLGIGTTGQVLGVAGGIPAWETGGINSADYLATLIARGLLIYVPTIDWAESNAGSGDVIQGPVLQYLDTGATDASRAYCQTPIGYMLGRGLAQSVGVNWDKDLRIFFIITRSTSVATAVARVQIKSTESEGVLAVKGLGIQITNLTLVGESYGTERATTGSTVLTAAKQYLVEIRHKAGVSIEWLVDGVSLGVNTTAAQIPSGAGAADGVLVCSITNGAATLARLFVGEFWLWQE